MKILGAYYNSGTPASPGTLKKSGLRYPAENRNVSNEPEENMAAVPEDRFPRHRKPALNPYHGQA